MYSAAVLLLLTSTALLHGALSAPAAADDHYTTRFDAIDVDQILSNERIFKRYMDCLLDKGRCTPEARELKSKYLLNESIYDKG